MLRAQTLDSWQLDFGILNCSYRVQSVHNQDLAASLATAINQWQIDAWLSQEARLRASLVVPSQNPALAAAEIDRFGDHPGFVQLVLPVRSALPYGNRNYDPIFERPSATTWPSASNLAARPAIRPHRSAGPRPMSKRSPAWRRSSSPRSSA
ncbi:MAG: amidohydrolase family protein [Caldilineaceae bacterium]|nr:amidohydrolase family protein [Caldilineaceae bacterium]